MKNKIDINQALLAFDKIRELGNKSADGFEYEGICANTDFDGYTVILKDKLACLTIYFHNKYELTGSDNKAMDRLITNLTHIAKSPDP